MTQKTKKTEGALLFFVLSSALVLPLAAWNGFVISKLWHWFIVPLGVISVGVWEAAGVSVLLRLLTMDPTLSRDSDQSPGERFGSAVSYGLLVPAVCLGFGALYHAFA